MRLDPHTLTALARVNATEPKLVEWLEARLVKATTNMSNQQDSVSLRWAQGRVQELNELLTELSTAQTNLGKVTHNASSRKSVK